MAERSPGIVEAVTAGTVPSELNSAAARGCEEFKAMGLSWRQSGGSAGPEFSTTGSQEHGKGLTAGPQHLSSLTLKINIKSGA